MRELALFVLVGLWFVGFLVAVVLGERAKRRRDEALERSIQRTYEALLRARQEADKP